MTARSPEPGQTWREAAGKANVHLDSGQRVERPWLEAGPKEHAVCGTWFSGPQAVRRLTLDVTLVSCKNCRKRPAYRCRLFLLDREVREHAAVLLDYIADHPGDIHHDPSTPSGEPGTFTTRADLPVRPLIEALRARRFAVDWLLQPDATKAVRDAEALAVQLGQGALDAIVASGDMAALRAPALLSGGPLPLFDRVLA